MRFCVQENTSTNKLNSRELLALPVCGAANCAVQKMDKEIVVV